MDWRLIIEKIILERSRKRNKQPFHTKYYYAGGDNAVSLYKRKLLSEKVVAAFGSEMVMQSIHNKNWLYYYHNYRSCIRKRIVLSPKRFPGLIPNSSIDQVMLLPYMRELDEGRYVKCLRLVIITNKCQVFHNYPSRSKEYEGRVLYGDDVRFEESAIWDMPGHKYPSRSDSPTPVERFFPFLPENAYDYHPILNTSEGFKDKYNNGGFGASHKVIVGGKEEQVSRFYFPKRIPACNSFHHIGGEEPDYKMTIIGTYRANNGGDGVRTVIFATDDGGRNWFAKYEFGDLGSYEFAQGTADWRTGFGNPILIQDSINGGGLSISKRAIISPSAENKEPNHFFIWSNPIEVKDVTKGVYSAIVTTKEAHGLETGNVITIKSSSIVYPFVNNEVSSTSGGNGILFKVKVIDEISFEIYEYIHSSDNPICCRHIHQINRVKDGWLIGTGEIYPNGWLLFFQMKEADTFSIKKAWEQFDIFRLNSTEDSVQRTLGAIILDDKEQTLIFASDHDTLERAQVKTPVGRSIIIRRSSTGVFKGKLSDIDNRNQFVLLYEAKEPSFLFKRINNNLLFAGQRGEFAVSSDLGVNWHSYRIDTDTFDYHGVIDNYVVIGDYLIELK